MHDATYDDTTLRRVLAGAAWPDGHAGKRDGDDGRGLIRLVAAPQCAAIAAPAGLAAGLLCSVALGAPGDLDPTFGNAGRAIPWPDSGQVWAVAPVGDGYYFAGDEYDCFDYYGSYYCDDGFGFTGRLLGTGEPDQAYAAAVLAETSIYDLAAQADGKAVGVGVSASNTVMTVFRLLANGALDPDFGTNGVVGLSDPGGAAQAGYSLVLDADGRIVVAGVRGDELVVVRLLPDGKLDLTFGTAGVYVGMAGGGLAGKDVGIARAPAGGYRIWQNGPRPESDPAGCQVLALSAGGVPEPAFGISGTGIAPADGSGAPEVTCSGIAVQADGAVVLAGTKGTQAFATRLLASGVADPGFTGAAVAGAMRDASAVALGRTGSIYVAGHDKSGLSGALVVRLQADGLVDALFGTNGAAQFDLESRWPSNPTVRDMKVLTNESLLVAGDGTATHQPFVARLLGSGGGPGILSMSSPQVLTQEGSQAVVNVRRIGGSTGAVSVAYQTADGSATAGDDYVPGSGRLTWGDGDVGERQVTIAIAAGTTVFEPQETFGLVLSDPQGGAGLGAFGANVIVRGDGFPGGVISISSPVAEVFESAPFAIFNVRRDYYSAGSVSVTVTPVGRTATADDDFTAQPVVLTWADGEMSTKEVRIPLRNDKKQEGQETFAVELADATGDAVISPQSVAVMMIVDDDRSSGGGRFDVLALLSLGLAAGWRRLRRIA